MQMTREDEKQDIWVQQMRTVQKLRQQKVKEGHQDLCERKSISVTTGNTLLTVRKENRFFFRKRVRLCQEKDINVPQVMEITDKFPYFKENYRKEELLF